MAKVAVPPPPVLDDVPAPIAKAFTKVLGKQGYVDTMRRSASALGTLLAKNKAALAKAHTAAAELAHGLAALGVLEAIKNKPARLAAYERKGQLEVIAMALRLAGPANDATLAALAKDVGDGGVRGILADVLGGGQINLKPGAQAAVAALIDDSEDTVALRCAYHALYATKPQEARARWTRELGATPPEPHRVREICDQLELYENDHTAWAGLVYPLALHRDRTIAIYASSLVAKQRAMFLGYVGWAVEHADLDRAVEMIARYLLRIHDRERLAELAEPLRAMRTRAQARKRKAAVTTLDRMLQRIAKLGVPLRTHAEPIAHVGTDGGPPLVVPAEHLAAWRGAEGPKPFDSGESDYERACDARPPAVIAVGKGSAVVLDEQGCDVHAEPDGLRFVASGSPDEEVAKAWKKLGAIAVSAKGLVVLDAAEVGAKKGVNRAKVSLAAGRYDVLAHRPAGFGGDYNAVRLVRAKR